MSITIHSSLNDFWIMRFALMVAVIGLFIASPLHAQQAIGLNETVLDSLQTGDVHRYALDLEADQFVLGNAAQKTVDVVVTIYAPDEKVVRTFDGPARGPEMFQFESEAPGSYVIEIKPFEEEEGDYTLKVNRIEAVKTSPVERVDQLLAQYDSDESPGAVVGVVKDGKLAFSKGYGRAHLSYDIPFTAETVTNIGSTSKQFTAFSIALLAERGELSLDDDVRDHIPELPDFGKEITLRHMMTHTTGYREFLNLIALTGRQLGKGDYIDRDELIEIVQRQPELQNDPGAEWNYNNTSFGLLTIVVERVTGQAFQDWMEENVFEPLGMHHTMFRKSQSHIIPNSSMGYVNGDEGYVEASDLGGAMGAGGLYTTVGDLAKWMANYHDPVVGSKDLMKEMTTPYILTNGDTTSYGLGLFVDEQRGLKRIQHGGADIAHRSMFMYFPEINGGVVALSNYGSFINPAGEVAELFFGDRMMQDEPIVVTQNEEPGAFDPAGYNPEDFDAFAGRYELEAVPGFIMTFSRDGEQLYAQATGQPQFEIFPTSDSTFKLTVVEASMTFHREADGSVKKLTLHQNGNHAAKRLEEEPWAPDEADFAMYSGRYFSEELETFYDVMVEDSALVITQRRLDNIKLNASKKDAFRGSYPILEVTFTRDDADVVNGLLVSNVRSRGIRFEKQE